MENPKGSNSTETFLPLVTECTNTRFLRRVGEYKMFCKDKEVEVVERALFPVLTMGRAVPFPTIMQDGELEEQGEWSIPKLLVMCDEAPVSKNHSEVPPDDGGAEEFRAARRAE
jgi:hypothetical protein